MKVLYVVGTCLTKNTSANLSHNGYIQGLLENQCEVDIIMQDDSWGADDSALPRWKTANYYEYRSRSFADKLRGMVKSAPIITDLGENEIDKTIVEKTTLKQKIRQFLKKCFYFIFKQDSLYPLDKKWLRCASKFRSDKCYDLVVSNSSPAASHKLVTLLKKTKKIKYSRWIQIWEDPWYFDLYGTKAENIRQEEHILLKEASEIYYVSPLTLQYQKNYFPDCANKMKCIPLPFFEISSQRCISNNISFGYFGDFYSHTRNLLPFYQALCESNYKGYIFGDSDLKLKSTKKVEVSGRVTLDKLAKIQDETGILVHLCNLRGGQIPGKIYHYSATNKPILFILDGTEMEKKMIKEYFSRFNRYYFCDNNEESIKKAIEDLILNIDRYYGRVVEEFSPKSVVKELLEN